jgi:hypothetical protein
MAVNIKITVFWNTTSCTLVDIYQRFGRTCCLHFQGNLQNVGINLLKYMMSL